MKTAHSVSITTRHRKSADPNDLHHDVFMNRTKYYQAPGRYVQVRSLACPMSEMAAMQLADQLKNQTDAVVEVFELLADSDQYLPANLDELMNGPVKSETEPACLRNLKTAIDGCVQAGMTKLAILAATNKQVLE